MAPCPAAELRGHQKVCTRSNQLFQNSKFRRTLYLSRVARRKVIRVFSAFCLRLKAGYAKSFVTTRLSGGLSHPRIALAIASSGLELIEEIGDPRAESPTGNFGCGEYRVAGKKLMEETIPTEKGEAIPAGRDTAVQLPGVPPRRSRILGYQLDISKQKKAEEDQAWLATIVESSEDAIISKSLEGIVTSWNEGAWRLFGYSAEEMLGQPGFGSYRLSAPKKRGRSSLGFGGESDWIIMRRCAGTRTAGWSMCS